METSLPQLIADPRTEYVRRLEAWKSTRSIYESRHHRIGSVQLAWGALTLILIGLALVAKIVSVYWVLAPLIAIVVLAVLHDRVLKARDRSARTVAYYERGLARLDHRWMGTGEAGERFQNDSHPYSRDLDIFGQGSIFELLCTARTRVGQETLAKWLLEPAPPPHVLARQKAVDDLRVRIDLREDLAVLAEDARALHPGKTWRPGGK